MIRLSVRAVGDAVAAVHGLTWTDLVAGSGAEVTRARHVTACLARQWTTARPAEIARILGASSIRAMEHAVAARPDDFPRLVEARAALAGIAETLNRLGIRPPVDVDPLSIAYRLLASRPETIPSEHLQVLAAYVVRIAGDATANEDNDHAA